MQLLEPGSEAVEIPIGDAVYPQTLDLKPSVLIVEDDNQQAGLYEDSLRSYGYETSVATSFSSAISKLENDVGIHVILTDYDLGDGNAIDLIAAFREQHPTNVWSEFIIVTGYASLKVAQLAISQGTRQLLTKPVLETELNGAVSGALRSSLLKHQRYCCERSIVTALSEMQSKVGLLVESGLIKPKAISSCNPDDNKRASLVGELERLHRRLRVMKALGIDERDWALLVQVAAGGDDGISVKSAAYALNMPLSSLIRRANALVRNALLKKWDDEVDARRSFLGITPKALTSLLDRTY